MNNLRENIKVDWVKKRFNGELCVFDFIDHGHYIAFMPSLNLSGYGDSKEDAHDMLLNFVLKEYVSSLFEVGEHSGNKELLSLGWEKSKFFPRELSKAHVDADGILKDFNLPLDTKIESQLLQVA